MTGFDATGSIIQPIYAVCSLSLDRYDLRNDCNLGNYSGPVFTVIGMGEPVQAQFRQSSILHQCVLELPYTAVQR